MNGQAWINNLQTIDCIECHTLLTAWLAGEVKTAEVCDHIHACPTSQARLQQAQAIPIELPMVLEGVEI